MTPGVLAPDPEETNPDDVPVLLDAGVAFPKLDASLDPSAMAGGAVDAESCVPCSAIFVPWWLQSSTSIPLAPFAPDAGAAGIAAVDAEDDGLPTLPLVLGAAEPSGLHRSTTSLLPPPPPPIGILEDGAGVLDPPPPPVAAAVAEDAIQLDMVPCAVVAGLVDAGAGGGAELLYGLLDDRPELAYGLAAPPPPLPPPPEAYGLEKDDAAADGVGRATPVPLLACC